MHRYQHVCAPSAYLSTLSDSMDVQRLIESLLRACLSMLSANSGQGPRKLLSENVYRGANVHDHGKVAIDLSVNDEGTKSDQHCLLILRLGTGVGLAGRLGAWPWLICRKITKVSNLCRKTRHIGSAVGASNQVAVLVYDQHVPAALMENMHALKSDHLLILFRGIGADGAV